MTDAEYKKAKKQAKVYNKKRKIAQSDRIDELTALSDDLRNLRNEILGGPRYRDGQVLESSDFGGISKAIEVHHLLGRLNSTYDSLENDAKLVAAQLTLLEPFRGILYRARPLIEKYKFVNFGITSVFRFAAAGIFVYLPQRQWKAGIRYITHPFDGSKKDISDDESFANFIKDEMIPAVEKFYQRVSAIDFSQTIYFDNKLFYELADFQADNDRYLLLGDNEKKALLGAANFALSGLYGSIAYTWDGFFEVINKLASTYGFDTGFNIFRDVEGATAKSRNEKIMKKKKLFILRDDVGAGYMEQAYLHYKEGVRHFHLAWIELKDSEDFPTDPAQLSNLIDPRVVQPFNRIIGNSFEGIENILESKQVESLLISGEAVTVDVRKFFLTKPPKDLKAFLPTGYHGGDFKYHKKWDKNKEDFVKTNSDKGSNVYEFRDYLVGAPNEWNLNLYNEYFPSIDPNKQNRPHDQIKNAARILSQTWGGWIIGIPMAGGVL